MGDKHQALAILPLERIPSTHYTGVWVGLRASLIGCGKEKIPCLHWGSNPKLSSPSKLLLTLYTLENILITALISSYLQISAPCKISILSELIHVHILLFSVTASSCVIVLYLSTENMTISGNKRSRYKYSEINEEYCN